jgi:hypothetical protein
MATHYQAYRQACGAFGLTPADRTHVRVERPAGPLDEFEAWEAKARKRTTG